jgi:hypothetical protein
MSLTADSIRGAHSAGLATPLARRSSSEPSGFGRQLADAVSGIARNSARASGDLRTSTRPAVETPRVATPADSVPTASTPETRTVGNPFAVQSPALSAAELAKQAEPKATLWCPWEGPRDSRDAVPCGGGLVTASGAPKIADNAVPTRNQYNYTGPAAKNPYFTNPGNPLREGYVAGFNNWFINNPAIVGPNQKSTPANPVYYATEEGAKEALRLVQQYEPGAQLVSRAWGGGPFLSNQPMYSITLPNGKELNAGGILESYYNHGCGVAISSDWELERTVRLA